MQQRLEFDRNGQCTVCGRFDKLWQALDTDRSSGVVKARAQWEVDTVRRLEVWEVWRRQDVFVEMCAMRREVVWEKCRGDRPSGRRTFWRPRLLLADIF